MTAWHHFAVSGVETWLWLPPLAALVIAFFTSMVGISGAFLLVPFQLSVLGFASPAASATNLVFNLVAIPGGMLRYARENRLFWPLALIITAGGAPGTLAGAWLRTHWLAERARFESFVAAILAYLAWRVLADWRRAGTSPAPAGTVRLLAADWREIQFAHGATTHAFPVLPMLGLSCVVGVIGTAYGIGGGSFMVPLCLAVWRLPLHAIAGATQTATLLTSALALAAYAWLPAPAGVAARPDWALGLAFGVGGLAGAYLGACMQKRVPQRRLKGLLAVLLAGLAIHYAWPA
ncbi:MAG: sulfite exporter TauE/SafE family protein [Pseudomonadota bacterium]